MEFGRGRVQITNSLKIQEEASAGPVPVMGGWTS